VIGALVGGRYVVRERLGTGGMGVVYRARHEALGRTFALKLLRRDIVLEQESFQRFARETRITAQLRHPHLVEVVDVGELTCVELPSLGDLRQPYFVMELLEGQTLGDAMREGPMDPRRVATIGAQVAAALAVAHEAGVIHRDLKPENVFLVRSGGPPLAKVLDFGVAKLLHAAKLTRPNTVFGTPYYMSPEQATDAPIDGRVDQYALGVVMYEALTGTVPFDDPTHLGVMRKHVEEAPVDVLTRMPDASNADVVGAIVMRCLAKRPEDRWASTHDLARALEQAADETWFAVRSSSFVGPLPEPSRLPRAPSQRPPSSPSLERPLAAVPSDEPAPAPRVASMEERAPRARALAPSRLSLERVLLLILAALLAIAALLAALVFSRGMA